MITEPSGNRLPRWLLWALAAAPAAALATFYLAPLVTLLLRVVDGTSIRETFNRAGLWPVVWFTLWQATVSTVATVVVGIGPAYLLGRYRFVGRRALLAITTVPFMLPTVVVGAAFAALLPDSWNGTVAAMVLGHVFFNIAVVVRVTAPMWAAIPTDLTDAARTLGAPTWQVAWRVVLPLLRPALLAAASVVFLFCFTSFGVAKLLGGPANPTIEVEIARRATQLGDVGGAAVLAMLQLAMLAVLLLTVGRLQRSASVPLAGGRATRTARTARQRFTVGVAAGLIAVAMLAPLASLVMRSLRIGGRWTLDAWRQLGEADARPGVTLTVDPIGSLGTSLRFALVAALASVVFGTLAVLAINAIKRRGRLLDVGLMLPLGTSAVTVGLGMVITFDVAPVDWRAEWWLIPIGHALIAIPFVVRALLPVLASISPDQRAAAASLGASPLRGWWTVEAARLRGHLVAAAGFAAAISLGEFGATTVLTRSGTETLPIAIDGLIGRVGALPRAQGYALATILLVVTASIIVACSGRLLDSEDRGA